MSGGRRSAADSSAPIAADHSLSARAGTESIRLRTRTKPREPTHPSISGCAVARGIRASRSSTTTSTICSTSDISRSAFAMWPGYHSIVGRPAHTSCDGGSGDAGGAQQRGARQRSVAAVADVPTSKTMWL